MENGNFDDFKINEIDINFVERMLKSLPSNIYFKDMEGKYVFCTHYWNHINTPKNDPTWTIRGKYDIDIRKDKENAIKAMEEEVLEKVNNLGIGAAGLGGTVTALAVNINTYPTHIAGLPVAVNMCCHVNRHVIRTI